MGKLPAEEERALDHLTGQDSAAGDWKGMVEHELGVDTAFVKRLFDVCTDRMEENRAVLFILRGFGCPDPVGRLREVLG